MHAFAIFYQLFQLLTPLMHILILIWLLLFHRGLFTSLGAIQHLLIYQRSDLEQRASLFWLLRLLWR